MRGDDQQLQTGMFSYVALEDRIPADHPLRGVRTLVDAVLAGMSKDFDGRTEGDGPRLRRGLLGLLLFFGTEAVAKVEPGLGDRRWGNHAVFSKNRERLLNQDLAQKFFAQVKQQAAGRVGELGGG